MFEWCVFCVSQVTQPATGGIPDSDFEPPPGSPAVFEGTPTFPSSPASDITGCVDMHGDVTPRVSFRGDVTPQVSPVRVDEVGPEGGIRTPIASEVDARNSARRGYQFSDSSVERGEVSFINEIF